MKRSVRGWVFAVLIAASAAGLSGASVPLPAEVSESLGRRISAGYNMSVVVGIQDANGPRFYSFGRLARGGVAPDERTIFEIGSITKAFTATLLWQMVRRGEISLEDPIAKYLPADVKPPEGGGRPITFEDLATHTSGLPRLPSNLRIARPEDPYADYDRQQLWSFLSSHTLSRPVGSKYEYSNAGVALLGQLLARRAGTSYAEAIKLVTEPLGLIDTVISLSPGQEARLAQGHSGVVPVPAWHTAAIEPAGALRSSAADLLRFAAINAGLVREVPAAPFSAMHSPRKPAGDGMSIGLGWHLRENGNRPIVWHNGGTGGYRSFAGFVAGERAVVLLSNSNQSVDDVGFHLLEGSRPLVTPPATMRVDPRVLANYAGRYQLGLAVADLQVIDDHLTIQLTNQPRFTLYAASPTEFFVTAVPAKITFTPDASGRVSEFVLHQNGLTPRATRIENK